MDDATKEILLLHRDLLDQMIHRVILLEQFVRQLEELLETYSFDQKNAVCPPSDINGGTTGSDALNDGGP